MFLNILLLKCSQLLPVAVRLSLRLSPVVSGCLRICEGYSVCSCVVYYIIYNNNNNNINNNINKRNSRELRPEPNTTGHNRTQPEIYLKKKQMNNKGMFKNHKYSKGFYMYLLDLEITEYKRTILKSQYNKMMNKEISY